jgi:tripartite-type tricarboxylate transporter receptor subunit TctC
MAATGTPAPIINDMSKQIEAAMKSEAITKWLAEQDGYATYAGPADYKTFLDSEFTRYKQIITDLGLKQE